MNGGKREMLFWTLVFLLFMGLLTIGALAETGGF